MDFCALLNQNLLTPPILFFITGLLMGITKIDFKITETISKFLSLYLIMALGIKGGHALHAVSTCSMQMMMLFVIGIGVSIAIPFVAYALLHYTTKLDPWTCAAIAAHYGSVSVITYIAAVSFLHAGGIPYPGYMIAVLAAMEAPAIVSGIYLAAKAEGKHASTKFDIIELIRNSGCVILLFGTFIIGFLSGESGFHKLSGFFEAPFQGVLSVFLLDMGLYIASQRECFKELNWSLIAFGLYMPLLNAFFGLLVSLVLGLDKGTGMLFMVLCASASYIAAPAAMRLTVPKAKAAIYLPMALAVNFPFNIIIGIPLYYVIATWFLP